MQALRTIFVSALAMVALASPAFAQQQGKEDEAAKKARIEEEWKERKVELEARKADGPCPFVKILYDAARYHEFKDNKESTTAAMWTGDIEGISSDCTYHGDEPITVGMQIGFTLGRGPQAEGQTKIYHYWVAVTERDGAILAKEEFELPVTFAPGQERLEVNTVIESVVIPRASSDISGGNFEILIGFDVTPQMVDFNRQGKHFRTN